MTAYLHGTNGVVFPDGTTQGTTAAIAPINSQAAGYTCVLADMGKCIYASSAGTFTIPANGSVAFPTGTCITFYNPNAGNCTIAITTDTMRLAGVGTTGSRTLAQYGMVTAMKVTATEWVISGAGLT